MTLLTLFWSFFQIGLFGFGGGYASLPLIKTIILEGQGWLTEAEFVDLLAISQMTPGPIGLNASTFVGTRVAGTLGAILATAGYVFPALIICSTLAYFYTKYKNLTLVNGVLDGLRPIVVALISSACISIAILAIADRNGAYSWQSVLLGLIVAAGVYLLRRFKWNGIFVMLGCGVIAGLLYAVGITF